VSDELTIEYEVPQAWRAGRPLYGVYVLFHDTDAEPLGVENIIDFDDRESVFFMVDAEGNRWFLPLASIRWVEITPMEAL
jgi:hypothetical protein